MERKKATIGAASHGEMKPTAAAASNRNIESPRDRLERCPEKVADFFDILGLEDTRSLVSDTLYCFDYKADSSRHVDRIFGTSEMCLTCDFT